MSKSPQAAARLLNYLEDSPYFESMIGDLDEFCVEGRSQAWYWRQTLIAITRHFMRDLWSNRLPALQALILVWACVPLYNLVRLFALKILVMSPLDLSTYFRRDLFVTSFAEVARSLGQGFRSDGTAFLLPACAILILIAWSFGLATGWLVTRLHRQHHRTLVVLYMASMLATVLPTVGSLAIAAHATQTFGAISHFFVYSANNTALIAGIFMGGLLRRRPDPNFGGTSHFGGRGCGSNHPMTT